MNRIIQYTRANSAIFPYVQILFTVITVVLFFQKYSINWWLLSLGVYFLTGCLGVTITFHRYLTHRSFHLPKYLEYLFSWFGAMGGTGSPLGWVAVHKQHHQNSDKKADPHSPHIYGWKVLFSSYNFDFDKWQVRRLITDRFHVLLHNYYHLVLVVWALLLLLIDVRLLLFGFIVPVAIQIWISNMSNWGNHLYGYRNFETGEDSRNTWWLAMITWGEGWHNNHHRYPGNWNLQKRWWELDISSLVIRFIRLIHPRPLKSARP